jgi:hypothetical protein
VGTHQELLAMRGIYYKLFELQYQSRETEADESDRPSEAVPG